MFNTGTTQSQADPPEKEFQGPIFTSVSTQPVRNKCRFINEHVFNRQTKLFLCADFGVNCRRDDLSLTFCRLLLDLYVCIKDRQ